MILSVMAYLFFRVQRNGGVRSFTMRIGAKTITFVAPKIVEKGKCK